MTVHVVAPAPPTPASPALPLALPGLMTGALVLLVLGAPWVPGLVLPSSLVVATLWGLHVIDTRRLALPPLLVAAAAVPVAQALTLPTAVDPVRSAVLTVATALGWASAAAFASLTDRQRATVLIALIASLLVVCASSITGLGRLNSLAGGSVVDGRAQGPFAQPNELGAYVVFLLPVCVAAATCARRHTGWLLVGVSALPVLGALALSLSRGAWAGAAAAMAVLVLLLPRIAPAILIAVGAMTTLVLGLALLDATGPAGVVLARIGSLDDPSGSPDDHRPQIWGLALGAARERPFLGLGPGGLETWASRADSPLALEPPLHAHNLVLTVLCESGAVGLLALVAVVAVLARRLWSAATHHTSWLVAGPLAGLSGAAVHGIIDVPWRNPALTATAWLLAGAAAAHMDQPLRAQPERHPVNHPTSREREATRRSRHGSRPSGTRIDDPGDHGDGLGPADGPGARRGRRRRAWPQPALLALILTGGLLAGLQFLPSQHEATSVVGLRSETADGAATIAPDEIKLIAQQYSVALSDEAAVDRVSDELGLPPGSTTEASVDPETTTVRISVRSDTAQEAAQLANRLSKSADERAERDPQVVATTLSPASAEHTTVTPSRPLLFACGLSAILVLSAGLWLMRRQR